MVKFKLGRDHGSVKKMYLTESIVISFHLKFLKRR